jgi:hypothetical protein
MKCQLFPFFEVLLALAFAPGYGLLFAGTPDEAMVVGDFAVLEGDRKKRKGVAKWGLGAQFGNYPMALMTPTKDASPRINQPAGQGQRVGSLNFLPRRLCKILRPCLSARPKTAL